MKKKAYVRGISSEESADKIRTTLEDVDDIKFINFEPKEESVTITLKTKQIADEEFMELIEKSGNFDVTKIHDLN